MSLQSFYYDPEKLGRKRLPDNKSFRATLNGRSAITLSALTDLLPSNYPKTESSNVGILLRVLGREATRQQLSMEYINNDKVFTTTRIEYLQRILGERLFLSERIAPVSYNDVAFRNYLISIKDAYLKGSTVTNIEDIVNKFTKQQIVLKELYLDARKPNSSYNVTDTHMMVLEVFVDDIFAAGQDLASLSSEIDFFINLVKPAHVLYDTKYIWTEILDINKVHDIYFGDTGGGCVPLYLTTPFNEKTVLAKQILIVSPSTTGAYRIGSIHDDHLVIYLDDDTKVIVEPGKNGTQIFGIDGKRVLFQDLHIGQYVLMESVVIPGDFQFHWTPPDLLVDWDSRFYKDVFRKPAFQESVKKIMDSHGRFPLQIKSTPTTLCDRWVQDLFQPIYEDLRKDCSEHSETPKTYSVTLADHMWNPRFSWENLKGVSLGREFTGDTYSFTMSYGALTDSSGNPAIPSDVSFFRDGTAIPGAVESLDSTTGYVSLFNTNTFWVPLGTPVIGSTFQFDYYHDSTVASDEFVFGVSHWQLPNVPVSDGGGTNQLALPADVHVSVNGIFIPNAVADINSILGHVTLQSSKNFWITSPLGRTPRVGLTTDSTSSLVIGTGSKTLIVEPGLDILVGQEVTVAPDGSNKMVGTITTYNSISGNLVVNITSTVGSGTYTSWDVTVKGDEITIGYYQSGTKVYTMLMDDIARTLDDNMYLDGAEGATDPLREPAARIPALEIGYKFRADLLHHASVLNSSDTLLLNNYQKPANRASIVNRQDNLNHFNYFFSPEHLYDTDPDIVLNDQYLDKDNEPVLKLQEGTPPFQKTYASQPNLISQRKLQDIRKHHSLLMYSDLLLKEYRTGESVPLSSICDQASVSFKFGFKEDLAKIKECESWILFDTVTTSPVQVTISSTQEVAINLRVISRKLRSNFILRGLTPTNVTETVYTEIVPFGVPQTIFYMPDTISYDEYMDFPALPIYKDYSTLATAVDVVVRVDGIIVPSAISSFSPVTGQVVLGTAVDGVVVTFTYKIRSIGTVNAIDPDRSKILDHNHLFPDGSNCYDGYSANVGMTYNEYINFLSDDGQGIKFKYFNKDSQQIEEHVFNGPVFETYEAQDDEISAFESFPGALVRIRSPLNLRNPLNGLTDYGFLEGEAVRIRKKTIRELLPDRTFRTMKIVEALPV
jgi:hypothetical protein